MRRRRSFALVVLALAACGDGGTPVPDAGPADAGGLPAAADLLPPEVYDCRAAAAPPARTSTLPLGCYLDPGCPDLVVVAHRGSTFFAPENTLSAVRSAIALGVDLVEVDVRSTVDGVLVLMHDAEVDRTTDGSGAVSDLTLAELQALTLVTPETAPAAADLSCERVPTFADLLELCRGRIDVMVDAKASPPAMAEAIAAAGMIDQAILLDDASNLEAARAAVPGVRIMVRPQAVEEIAPLVAAFDPPPDVVHIDPGFDGPDTYAAIRGLGARSLMDLFLEDVTAVVVGDWTGYAEHHADGLDIGQCEYPFFALYSLGRASPP